MPVKPKLTRRQTERHRESIRVGNLISMLERNAQGKLKDSHGKPYELSAGKLRSIQILLDKAMANLSAVEHTNIDEPQDRQSLQEQVQAMKAALTPEDIRMLLDRLPVHDSQPDSEQPTIQ